jgi:hypothetical protein
MIKSFLQSLWQASIKLAFSSDNSATLMVFYGCLLHLVWAGTLLIENTAMNGTAMHALYVMFGSVNILFVALLAVSGCAAWGAISQWRHAMFLVIPQQIFLLVSAAGALEAMWLGQFADGVLRSSAFIVADQIYVVLTAFGHSIAIISLLLRDRRRCSE